MFTGLMRLVRSEAGAEDRRSLEQNQAQSACVKINKQGIY